VSLVFLPEVVGWLNKLHFKYANTRAFHAGPGKEFSVDIQEDGIQAVGVPNKQEWSYFSSYSESAQAFILYRSIPSKLFLPKCAFNPDSLNSFRQILKANIAPR
jgi:YcxB-like protein